MSVMENSKSALSEFFGGVLPCPNSAQSDAILQDASDAIPRDVIMVDRPPRERVLAAVDTFRRCYELDNHNIYFVCIQFSATHIIPKLNKTYHTCRQLVQYDYVNHFLTHKTKLKGFIAIYEQTLKGMIHVHLLLSKAPYEHYHDTKCQLLDLFRFNKRDCKIDKCVYFDRLNTISEYNNVVDYLLNKTKKIYETVDWNIFKPLIKL